MEVSSRQSLVDSGPGNWSTHLCNVLHHLNRCSDCAALFNHIGNERWPEPRCCGLLSARCSHEIRENKRSSDAVRHECSRCPAYGAVGLV